jgi:uncharacterized repeat protein (TIGR04076 family)
MSGDNYMTTQTLKGTLYEDQVALKRFRDFEHRYYQEVTIAGVMGECPFGHREGEKYKVSNCNNDGLCGALYTRIHDSILTLHYWGSLPWEKDPDRYGDICPEMKVKVAVRRFEKEKPGMLKSPAPLRTMTGKGFPAIDRYRAFIEILGVEKICAWGNKAGQRFEIDPFNTGGVCGFLYRKIHPYLNVLLSGVSFPWAAQDHEIMSVCPDSYNQTSFRLFVEERQ